MPHLENAVRSKRVRTMVATVVLSLLAVPGLDAVTGTAAHAAGSNWSVTDGTCYGWTTWDANHVTGHVRDNGTDLCFIEIEQIETDWNGNLTVTDPTIWRSYTSAQGGQVNTPTWWHGLDREGLDLQDFVCIWDQTLGRSSHCSPYYT